MTFPIFAPSFEMLLRRLSRLDDLPPQITIRPAMPDDLSGDLFDDPKNRWIAIA